MLKKISIIPIILCITSCAYNSTTITTQGTVTVVNSVDKPVTIDTLRSLGQGATVPIKPLP